MTEFFEYAPADGEWNGKDDSLLAVSFDPAAAAAGFTISAGTLYLSRLRLRGRATVSSASVVYFAAAATPSGTYLALYNADTGARLAVTTDQSTAFSTTTGVKTAAFSTPVELDKGSYFVGFLVNSAGTVPHLAIGGTVGVNLARTGLTSRFATGPTGNTTTVPAASTGTPTAINDAIWASIS